MGRTVIIVALGLVVGVGVAYSVYDYRGWRYEETKNFGHGPGDTAPKKDIADLSQIYRNDLLRLRLRIPESWSIKQEAKFTIVDPKNPPDLRKLLPLERREEAVRFGDRVVISIQRTRVNLPDLVSMDAGTVKDRSYINNGRISITIVQLENKIMAYATHDEYTYIISWIGIDDGTFAEILKTVAIT